MNTLQIELNEINEKLELLTYRKTQLDAIMGEYSDVINRVKNLISTMEDANVEPSNLLFEIEGIIHGVSDAEMTAMTPEDSQTQKTPQTPSTATQTGDDSQSETAKPFTFDLRLFPKAEILQRESTEPSNSNDSSGYKSPDNTIDSNTAVCNQQKEDTEAVIAVTNVENATAPDTDDDDSCDTDGLDDDYPFDYDCDDKTPEPEQRGNSLLFYPNTYWDNQSSVRMFIPKKRRYRGELEAIIDDCIEQKLIEHFEINECGNDWIIGLSPVTDEMTVNAIIDNFHPKHTDGDATPTTEPVKLMAMVATVPSTKQPSKIQLNDRAYRRGEDTLLVGFSNKQLMASWYKWAKDSWGDRIHIDDIENLEGFKYCLSILWYGKADWERLKALDYSLKPTEQQRIETPDFEYKEVSNTTTQIFRDGVLIGLAIDCDSHWKSPQFKDEQFESREEIAEKLWELINNF